MDIISRFRFITGLNQYATALTDGIDSLTYKELDNYSDHLAETLRAREVKHKDRVALCTGRSIESIIAMLAILKCGAAYVPVDTTNETKSRIENILISAEVKVVLISVDEEKNYSPICDTLRIDIARMKSTPAIITEFCSSPDDRAYITFTSGSEGEPKGVIIPHRSVLRLVVGEDFVNINQRDVFLFHSSISFDASTFEIWGALLNGCCLVVYSESYFDPNKILKLINEQDVSVLWLTSTIFNVFAEHYINAFKKLRVILSGGDVVKPESVRKVIKSWPHIAVINGYGPTENTTFTCTHTMTIRNLPDDICPIGIPIKGTQIHILDSELNPTTQGELYISGLGLAIGYLCEKTTHKNFILCDKVSKEVIYKSGDIVKINSCGLIEFVGRHDSQVKIRGYRVSLNEIRNKLLEFELVIDARVDVIKDKLGDCFISADVYLRHHNYQCEQKIKEKIVTDFPQYMHPEIYNFLIDVQTNKNGKLIKYRSNNEYRRA